MPIYNKLIPEGKGAVANVIKNRIQENRKKLRTVATREHRIVDDEISEYEMYRYLGMTFPDSPFGQIIK